MKSKFRKINRGLILSLLVILGIVAYYVVLGIKAAPEKRLMDETLTGFFQQLAPAYLVPDEYKGEDVSREDVEKLSAELEAKFAPYFADTDSLSQFMEDNIIPTLESQTIYPTEEVVKAVCDYEKITEADIDGDTAVVKARAETSSEIQYYNVSYLEDGTIVKHPSGTSGGGSYTWETTISFTMQKVDGAWLITGYAGYWL